MALTFYKWLVMATTVALHPFYVSVTEINHNPKTRMLEVSCKMFLDDTEKALERQFKTPVELTKPRSPQAAQQMVSEYIKKHLQLKLDDRPVSLEFVGYEIEGASIWAYFQVNNISALHRLDVGNTLLYELFDSQTGILHVKAMGQEKSTKITNPVGRAEFAF